MSNEIDWSLFKRIEPQAEVSKPETSQLPVGDDSGIDWSLFKPMETQEKSIEKQEDIDNPKYAEHIKKQISDLQHPTGVFPIGKLADEFTTGASQSASGMLSQFVFERFDDPKEAEGFINSMARGAGHVAGDIPFNLIGAIAGIWAGPYGSAAGAGALPAVIKTTVQKYFDYQDRGGKESFGDFVNDTADVLSESAKGSAEFMIYGYVARMLSGLKHVPLFKALYNTKFIGKAAEKGVAAAGGAAAVTTAAAVSKGEMPSGEDLGRNIVMALGFEAAQIPVKRLAKIGEQYTSKEKKTPLNEFFQDKNIKKLNKDLTDQNTEKVTNDVRENALKTLTEPIEKPTDVAGKRPDVAGKRPEIPKVESIKLEDLDVSQLKIAEPPSKEIPVAQKTLLEPPKGETHEPIRAKWLKKQEPPAVKRFEKAGDLVCENKYRSEPEAGWDLQSKVKERVDSERKNIIKPAYDRARSSASGHSGEFKETIKDVSRILLESNTLEPSTGEQRVLVVAQRLLDNLTEIDENTSQRSNVNMSVSSMISTADSLASSLKYQDVEPDFRNRIRKIIHTINEEAANIVKKQGGNAEAIRQADRLYKEWSDRAFNDEVKPFLTKLTNNPETLYRSSITPESFRALRDLFMGMDEVPKWLSEKDVNIFRKHTERGMDSLGKVSRDIVERRLDKYIKDPSKVGTPEYTRDINNLGDIFDVSSVDKYLKDQKIELERSQKKTPTEKIFKDKTEYETAALKQAKKEAGKRTSELKSKLVPPEPKPEAFSRRMAKMENAINDLSRSFGVKTPMKKLMTRWEASSKAAAKYKGKSVEYIDKQMDSADGVHELKKDLAECTNGDKIFRQLSEKKVNSMLSKNKITTDTKASELYKMLNKAENYRLFEQLIGKEDTKELYKMSKKLANKRLSSENIKKIGGKTLKFFGIMKFLSL